MNITCIKEGLVLYTLSTIKGITNGELLYPLLVLISTSYPKDKVAVKLRETLERHAVDKKDDNINRVINMVISDDEILPLTPEELSILSYSISVTVDKHNASTHMRRLVYKLDGTYDDVHNILMRHILEYVYITVPRDESWVVKKLNAPITTKEDLLCYDLLILFTALAYQIFLVRYDECNSNGGDDE